MYVTRGLIYRTILLGSGVLAAGCIGGTNTTRLYQGDRALAEVAVVFWDGGGSPILLAVDGTPVPQGKVKMNRVEVTPGTHDFTLDPTAGPTTITLSVRVEAGRCYRPEQRLIKIGSAPEAGEGARKAQYEPPTLAEVQKDGDQYAVCAMRGK